MNHAARSVSAYPSPVLVFSLFFLDFFPDKILSRGHVVLPEREKNFISPRHCQERKRCTKIIHLRRSAPLGIIGAQGKMRRALIKRCMTNLVLPLDQSRNAEIDSLASFRSTSFASSDLQRIKIQEQKLPADHTDTAALETGIEDIS